MPMKNPPRHVKRAWNLSTRYKMTPAQHAEIMASQGGKCAICGNVPSRPVVDHDHGTGKVRGILCHGCNIKLPAVEDAVFLRAALAYIGAAP